MLLDWIMKKLFSGRNRRMVNKLWPLVKKVNALAEEYQVLSDDQLRGKTQEFRERLRMARPPMTLCAKLLQSSKTPAAA